MSMIVVFTILVLCGIGIISALVLYVVAKKFQLAEDPRIDTVVSLLPGANCGGCGFPGCQAFAKACVEAETLDGLFCTPGGNDGMAAVAKFLGKTPVTKDPMIAVLRCNGSFQNRVRRTNYEGERTCAIEHLTCGGETDCVYGCLGQGDCMRACVFGAITIDPETGLPVIDDDRCVACGACVTACPKGLIELRKKGPKNRRVFVCCWNKDKGPTARKACTAACIGCMKCVKECPFEAITVTDCLAYIDPEKCRLCRKCVLACPTGAIHEVNFPARPAQPSTPVTGI